MTERTCNFIHQPEKPAPRAAPATPCGKPAEWELWGSASGPYTFVDSCTDHVGHLLDDSPETTVRPIKNRTGVMGGDPGLAKMQ